MDDEVVIQSKVFADIPVSLACLRELIAMIRKAIDDVVPELVVFLVTFSMSAKVLEADTLCVVINDGSDFCDRHLRVIESILLSEHLLWLRIGHRIA